MSNTTSLNPHKEEDEGYLAAESGRKLSENPYPRGTIRYSEWRRGWHLWRAVTLLEENDGYLAAQSGQGVSSEPVSSRHHPLRSMAARLAEENR